MCSQHESNVHLSLRTRQFYPLNYGSLALGREHLRHHVFSETNNNLIPYPDNWYAELSGQFNHFLSFLRIGTDIVFGIRDAVRLEVFLRKVAKMTRIGAVDDDVFHIKISISHYSLRIPRPRSTESHHFETMPRSSFSAVMALF
jgi:hypothetical protein